MAKQVFYAEWVREQQLNPALLATLYASNNAMAPRIQCGDHLLVDRSQSTVINGRVYALWYNKRLRIKRLYEMDDGSLLIEADNRNSRNTHICTQIPAKQRDEVYILGRIVHVQGTAGL